MALSYIIPKPKLTPPEYDITDGATVYFGGAFRTYFIGGDSSYFTSRQIFKAGSPHTGVGPTSTATPPYHYHLYQTETFDVKSGTLCYKIDGKEGKLEAGQKVNIPPYQCHTFWNDPSTGKDLDVHITVRGGDNPGFDDIFVQNFYGYLSSVTMAGSSPNPAQMLRFLESADVILADIPLGMGGWVNWAVGKVIGGGLLGYPTQFEVFTKEVGN